MDRIAAIGVATPGTMDIPAGMILDRSNLKPWQNVPVRRHVQEAFGLPTAFQNDANAAAYGEFWAGAGRGARSMVLFTLGTGVGGGIIVGGDAGGYVIEGEHSHGGEVGHIKIEMTNPRPCGCGRCGCLEAYASATAVVKRTPEALAGDGGRSSLHAVVRSGNELTSRDVFDGGGGRRRAGGADRGGDGLLPGGRGDEPDAHHRPGHGRLRRRHDRGGRRLPGAHPRSTSANWRSRCRRSGREICLRPAGQRRRLHRRGGVRPTVSFSDDGKTLTASPGLACHYPRRNSRRISAWYSAASPNSSGWRQ